MAGSVFQVGEQKIRPGVYVRVTSEGGPPEAVIPQGVVAALVQANWGVLNEPVVLESETSILSIFGKGGTLETTQEAFRGRCRRVLAYRLGDATGKKASVVLKDTAATPADVVKIIAMYVGTRGNDFTITIRDHPTDAGLKQLLLKEGTTLRQTVDFSTSGNQPENLVNAVNNSDSPWIMAEKIAAGNDVVANVTDAAMADGANPGVTDTEYSAGLSDIEALDWNVLVVDTNATSVHSIVQSYINRVRDEGKRVLAVIGEPTSVALADRLAHAKAFNDYAIIYVANGFKYANGTVREGYQAAARTAGMVAAANITDSLTHSIVKNAIEIIGALTNSQIEDAINSGALVFTLNALKQVHIEYGITTFVSPDANYDAGWKKIRRVRTRDNLINRITATWDPLIGKVNNSPDGRATLIAAAQGVINKMIAEGALLAGVIYEDPDNPPAGDSAWFVIQVDDVDSAEHVYLVFRFSFSPTLTV